jgi:hypothetical protein
LPTSSNKIKQESFYIGPYPEGFQIEKEVMLIKRRDCVEKKAYASKQRRAC